MRRAQALTASALLLVITIALAGCGVSATNGPVDEGEPAAGGPAVGTEPLVPPEPDAALQADELVSNLLRAAAGGGAQANERVKHYLTGSAESAWTDPPNLENPPLTVIRLVSGPAPEVVQSGRTPVTVQYETVGALTDRGRVDDLANTETKTLKFWVVPSGRNFRIDQIDGWPTGQLLLSDQGLREYYRMQPIYFWDREYTALVPDLRYVPQTINQALQAELRLNWLTAESSPWLSGAVQLLPTNTTGELIDTADDGALQVRLSETAILPDDDRAAAQRLMLQLQRSLSEGEVSPDIDIYIGDRESPLEINDGDVRGYLHTWAYREASERYDIVDGVVQPLATTSVPELLAAAENSGVVYAAIRRGPAAAAFVREDGSGPRLDFVTPGGSRRADLQASSDIGRPSFVPGTDLVLVPTGGPDGRLMAVSVASGASSDALGSRLPGVSTAVVSPDGRRVALVADGELYVAPLNVSPTNGTVTVGSATRQLLAGRLTATTVTWTSESWLLVAGTRGPDEQPTLWRVTADGVMAIDFSNTMSGLRVDDLVCWPTWRNTQVGDTEVRVVTDRGVYTFINQFNEGEAALTAPFFG